MVSRSMGARGLNRALGFRVSPSMGARGLNRALGVQVGRRLSPNSFLLRLPMMESACPCARLRNLADDDMTKRSNRLFRFVSNPHRHLGTQGSGGGCLEVHG